MVDRSEMLAFALELAYLGGDIAMSHYQKGPALQRKGDGTWVTEADVAVETRLRVEIAGRLPEHNVLGEEQGLASATGGAAISGAPTWIIDPIDGTHNYMSGIPIWATLVGLRTDEGFVLGVCHAPAIGETYDAAIGSGARMNGSPIKAASVDSLTGATTLLGDVQAFVDAGLEDFLEDLSSKSWRIRGFGDFWGHMLVARGAATVMVEPMLSLWDTAALVPIVTEAGAKLSHLDGTEWNEAGSCLTAPTPVHDEVLEMARKHAAT